MPLPLVLTQLHRKVQFLVLQRLSIVVSLAVLFGCETRILAAETNVLGDSHQFTVDALLSNEKIGRVYVSPEGNRTVVVVVPSRNECWSRQDGGLVIYDDYLPPEVCGDVHILSDKQIIRIGRPPNILGLFSPIWSPSGEQLAFLAYEVTGEAHIWLWDGQRVTRVTEHPIDPYLNIDALSGWDLSSFAWLDNDTLIAASISNDRIEADEVPVRHPGAALVSVWHRQASGEGASSSVLKSKVDRDALPQATIVKIDVASGSVHELATGSYTAISLSPNGQAALIVEAISNLQAPKGTLFENVTQNIIPNGFSLGLSHSRVGVIDLSQDGDAVFWLPSVYDPWFSSAGRRVLDDRAAAFKGPRPAWTGAGDRVAFVARRKPEVGAQSKLFVHDFSIDRTKEIRTSKLAPVSIAWAGDRLIYAQIHHDEAETECDATWCIIEESSEAGNAFDASLFGADVPKRVFSVGDALWFTAGGDLWAFDDEKGRARQLSDGEFGEVFGISKVAANADSVLVETEVDGEPAYMIALREGANVSRRESIRLPTSRASVRGFGGLNGVTVTEHTHSKGVDLWAQWDGDERATKIISLNSHLSGVMSFERERLDYKGGEGERLNGVLLRPAKAEEGREAPLVVRVYPKTYSDPDVFDGAANSRSFLNDAMLPAHGYAVLYPTITVTPPAEGGRLCDQFADDVIPAVEAAIAAGGVDPDRVFLFGHSFGGYIVNNLMTCTDRFAAGIAVAGFSDLFESYWRLSPPFKYSNHAMNADFGFHRAERSRQGVFNLGATPWSNPKIYMENSPVFHADKLNAPLLLIHGEFDAVSIAHSEKMYMAGRRLGKGVTFVRYWGVGHTWKSPGDIRGFWARIFRFLEEQTVRENQ